MKELHGIRKTCGRKLAKMLQEYKYENKRLAKENELLRDFLNRQGYPAKYDEMAKLIVAKQKRHFNTYGYRIMWLALKNDGIAGNPKTILRIMKKYDLLIKIRRRRKWVQMSQQLHK